MHAHTSATNSPTAQFSHSQRNVSSSSLSALSSGTKVPNGKGSPSTSVSVSVDHLSARHLISLKQRAYDHYAKILQRCGTPNEIRPLSAFLLSSVDQRPGTAWPAATKKRRTPDLSQNGHPQYQHTFTREDSSSNVPEAAHDDSSMAGSFAESSQRTNDSLNLSKSPAALCPVFGIPLNVLQAHFDDALPPCILNTMAYIEAELRKHAECEAEHRRIEPQSASAPTNDDAEAEDGSSTAAVHNHHCDQSAIVGVFRKAGLRTRISEMRALFDANPTLGNFVGGPFTDAMLFDYCDVLKQFFRDLPECLLTGAVSHFLLAVANSPEFSAESAGQNEQLRFETLHCAFMLLADANKRALRALFIFLQRVAAYEAETNMNLHNLAVCFCPSFFDFNNSGATSLFSGASSGANNNNNPTTIGVQWIITMIRNADRLFSIPKMMYDSWISEDRLALERSRTAQAAASNANGKTNESKSSKETKQRSGAGGDFRKHFANFFRSNKQSRDLEPVASLFVRPVTYKRGYAMRFDELGSRLLDGRVNFMRFVDYACQTLEKASESYAMQHSLTAKTNTNSPAASSGSASASASVSVKSSSIWLKYNLSNYVAFETNGIEICIKRSKFERKKLKEAAATASVDSAASSSVVSSPHDDFEQQALVAYPSICQPHAGRNSIAEHGGALWRVRFELADVPIGKLSQALWDSSFLRDIFDLELVETIEQFSADAVLERLRRVGPADQHVREYKVLRARRTHFSVAAPEAFVFVITSVVDFEAQLSRRTFPRSPNPPSPPQLTSGSLAEVINDAVISDLHILAEPFANGSHITLLSREELRGYAHEWYVHVWPIVLSRWCAQIRGHFGTSSS